MKTAIPLPESLAIVLLLSVAVLFLCTRTGQSQVPDRVFTSTNYTTCLLLVSSSGKGGIKERKEDEGGLWVGTRGGILRRKADGSWQKFTRQDGLPSHEVRHLELQDGDLVATFPTGRARWHKEKWEALPPASEQENKIRADQTELHGQTATALWHGARYAADATGLFVQQSNGGKWNSVGLPLSTGTHVSALLPVEDRLWAGLFGDGIWAFDGSHWQPLDLINLNLPAPAREITALAGNARTLYVGTRRTGLWEYHDGTWTHSLYHATTSKSTDQTPAKIVPEEEHIDENREEPIDHNCQALAFYHGCLYLSTLEAGLAVAPIPGTSEPPVWRSVCSPILSSNAPRQMVVFQDRLYLRHGNGKVDRYDARSDQWELDITAKLPRSQVAALCVDGQHLYIAQWGGWSEYDGRTWTSHLKTPELQGLTLTALCPQNSSLWIGTQGRGVAQVRLSDSTLLRWHDERHGLSDDWITALACAGNVLHAGTFVGGESIWDGHHWSPTTAPALQTENVTAFEPDGAGGLFVSTRRYLWHHSTNEMTHEISLPLNAGKNPNSNLNKNPNDAEIQCLCQTPDGLWIGTRTGLYYRHN